MKKYRGIVTSQAVYNNPITRPIGKNIMIKFEFKIAKKINGSDMMTPKAIGVEHLGGVLWLPRNVIKIHHTMNADYKVIEIPEWLAKRTELV